MILNPLTYVLLAQDAYEAIPQIGEESSSARAIVQSTIDGTAFAFPGTNNPACLLADADILADETSLGPMHQGFNRAALEILPKIEQWVTQIRKPVILCGHSEGAALALIIGGYLCKAGRPPIAIFAFEPPMVTTGPLLGDILIRNNVQVMITRNGEDIITEVPPIIGLRSAIQPFSLTAIGSARFPFLNLADHAIDRVVESIREGCQP